MMKLKSHAVG